MMSTDVKSASKVQDVKNNDEQPTDEPVAAFTMVSPPYSVFRHWERWAIVAMAGFAGLFSTFTANIYFPAIPTLANVFHESVENINLTVTVYMIVQGLAPSAWGSVADRQGRRLSFLLCLLILIVVSIGLAVVPTSDYWLLLVLRCLQAAGSASTIAISAGVVADIIPVEDRGGYIGMANIGPMIGPCLGPVVGGILSDRLGWRSIFWFLAIFTTVCFTTILLFFPETLRSLVGNGSIPAQKWNRALLPIIGRSTLEISYERPPTKPLPNPFKLFTHPDLMILLVSTAIIYSAFYAVSTTISSLFHSNFPFLSETEIGLCFLSVGGGGAIATITTGKLLDWQYNRVKKSFEESMNADPEKRSGPSQEYDSNAPSSSYHDNFPIEKACLQSQHVWIWVFVVSCIGYGWSMESKVNIAVPLVLQFILGYTMVAVMTNTQTLIVDLFPTQGSSVTAANNLVRCLMGAVAVSVVNIITNAIGPGWTYTLCGGICALTWPMLLLVLKMGPTWRKRRSERSR